VQSNPVLNVEPATQCQTKEGSKAHERNNRTLRHTLESSSVVGKPKRARGSKKKKKKEEEEEEEGKP